MPCPRRCTSRRTPLAAALLAGLARPGAGRGRTLTVGYQVDF